MLKRLTLLAVVIGIAIAGYYAYTGVDTSRYSEESATKNPVAFSPVEESSQPQQTNSPVSAPPPLRSEPQPQEAPGQLTEAGVVAETNRHRAQQGLPPLKPNTQLATAASLKVADMFAHQYFAHESPTGESAGDLARQVGYEYLNLGENLALGNYGSDVVLVQAWMDSPGHRENILNNTFTEIGVAVMQGTYEGHTTWLAVQEFGRPASACPAPSTALAAEIEANRALLAEWEAELKVRQEELENTQPKRGPAYNRKVEEYNDLVAEYNLLLEETRALIADYNAQVQAFNACVQ